MYFMLHIKFHREDVVQFFIKKKIIQLSQIAHRNLQKLFKHALIYHILYILFHINFCFYFHLIIFERKHLET